MKAVWKRIHAWLDANAPAGYGDLRPGASAAAIQAAEKALGLKLSADIKASYRVHDGQGNEPGLIGGEGVSPVRRRDRPRPQPRPSLCSTGRPNKGVAADRGP